MITLKITLRTGASFEHYLDEEQTSFAEFVYKLGVTGGGFAVFDNAAFRASEAVLIELVGSK